MEGVSGRFFAHSTQNKDQSDWQSLQEHLSQVAELAGRFAEQFGSRPLGHTAGLLHDVGK